MLKFYKLWPYATIIPGQSIGKSSERKSHGRFSCRERLQHCNSFLSLSAYWSTDRLLRVQRCHKPTLPISTAAQLRKNNKVGNKPRRVSCTDRRPVCWANRAFFPQSQPQSGQGPTASSSDGYLQSQIYGFLYRNTTDTSRALVFQHRKGTPTCRIFSFSNGKSSCQGKDSSCKRVTVTGSKGEQLFGKRGKKTRRNTYNLKGKKSDCLPVSLHLSMAAAESA